MKSKLETERLPFFVYGTLLPGQPNAGLWEDAVVAQVRAVLAGGCLYDMGSFPMLVEAEYERVVGVVNEVAEDAYTAVLARLDYLEGVDPDHPNEFGYERVMREVVIENASTEHGQNGRSLRAWVYMGKKTAVRGMLPIPGGNWVAYLALGHSK